MPNSVKSSSVTDVYGSLENVAMVTIAPEFDGALNIINDFVENNAIVSLG